MRTFTFKMYTRCNYGEGGLWFDNKTLVDYDGVFELSPQIIAKLEEWGYDASYAKP